MAHAIDKLEILTLLRASVKADLDLMTAAQRTVVDGATHEEHRPENEKDTRALEQSYLARGQAQRVVELKDSVNLLKAIELRRFAADTPITVTALVAVDDGQGVTHYFLAPAGGGVRLTVSGVEVRVITTKSPVGQALLGKLEGDDVDLRTPQGVSQCSIVGVS